MLPLLWTAEVRGFQHGPLNQMAINPLHTNTGENLHQSNQRVSNQILKRKVRILTNQFTKTRQCEILYNLVFFLVKNNFANEKCPFQTSKKQLIKVVQLTKAGSFLKSQKSRYIKINNYNLVFTI